MKHKRPNQRKQKSNPLRKQKVRVPRDYPWIVLRTILECVGQYTDEQLVETLTRVIRGRDVEGLLAVGDVWGLQSITPQIPLKSLCDIEVRLLLAGLLKRYDFPGDAELRTQRAYENIHAAERQCSHFNRVGYQRLNTDGPVFHEAERFIRRVLGATLPDTCEVTRSARHGPGATTSTSKGRTSAYDKYAEWPYHVTARCFKHAKSLILSDERWLGSLEHSYRQRYDIAPWCILDWETFWSTVFKIVPGNRITTVRKDARKDRPIAIEPDMNVMLQLGVDGYIRRRLKRWGIDLDNQIPNQVLARRGSVDVDVMSPCTIDLSNASDTVSLRIAKLLLPPEWYEYLCDLRSPSGILADGTRLRYSKLSSMGNGSTFAIESLLFASIVYGVSKHFLGRYPRDQVAVFGDDIVVPEAIYRQTCSYLEMAGFSVNTEKSFGRPGIKESCGTDWYHGQPVRPVFIKELPTYVSQLFCDRNRLYRWFTSREVYPSEVTDKIDALYRSWIPERFQNLIGPLSDEEFDTYWHEEEPPGTAYPSGYREITVLTSTLRRRHGPDFGFRKLMARLTPTPEPVSPKWHKLRSMGSTGSLFTVHTSYNVQRGVTRRHVFNWTRCYRSPWLLG